MALISLDEEKCAGGQFALGHCTGQLTDGVVTQCGKRIIHDCGDFARQIDFGQLPAPRE